MTNYLEKHSFCPPQISELPHPNVGIIVVIPCFDEPDLITSLQSLWNCDRPKCFVEVIVVINASENSVQEVIERNEKTFAEASEWAAKQHDDKMRFFFIENNKMPKKHAGVGLARKIGMDEAVFRFHKTESKNKIILSYDVDCQCDKNYLYEIEKHFENHPRSSASSIYFEHAIEGNELQRAVYEGIIRYELYLRYYRQGLILAGHPFAFHTVGSCFATRVNAYCEQGGMNKRQAGEDFYFLQKLISLGNCSEISTTRVIPSSRASHRVPFGTGKAIEKWLKNNEKDFFSYHPQTFVDLKGFCDAVPLLYANSKQMFPESISEFLKQNGFEERLAEIKANSTTEKKFIKRFYRWFNGFMALKFVHFARDNFYDEMPVQFVAQQLLELKGFSITQIPPKIKELLYFYRKLDRNINPLQT